MPEHDCRPTLPGYFLRQKNTPCRCRHCGKLLRQTNRWLTILCNLLIVLPVAYLILQHGLGEWKLFLIFFAADVLLNLCLFPLCRFGVDLSAEKDAHTRSLRR
ncbi:MAG: hypothetical protein IJE07_06575 [Clostridia bacterium]|nr:hypothetical protein [Clostridia bacterium]